MKTKLALVGPNGSGKTNYLRDVNGISIYTRGFDIDYIYKNIDFIKNFMKSIFHNIEDINMVGDTVFITINNIRYHIKDVGDGIFRVYRISLTCSLDKPETIKIDNIDDGLHPITCQKLIEQIDKTHHGLVCVCYNPYTLDSFNADQVLVFNNGKNKLLNKHSRYELWANELKAGEFWSYAGEDFVNEITT